MERNDSYIKAQMIEAAWKYAQHYGGVDHMLGVLYVIKNRQVAGWGTYLHILDTMEKWQAAPPKTTTHPDIWDRRFVALLGAVDGICDETRKPDISNGALYFGDTTDIQSEWFLERVARNPEKVRCGGSASWTYWK
jgi:hypothetical protein